MARRILFVLLGPLVWLAMTAPLHATPAETREQLRRACDQGVATSCAQLADMVARGDGGDRNWGAAVELAEKACALDHAPRCPHAVQLRQHPPDWRCTALDDCRRRCDEQLGQACRHLGELRARVPATERGNDLAYDPFERGCRAGDGPSCVLRGNRESRLDDAAPWYELGCKLGDRTGCMYVQFVRARSGSTGARKSLRALCPSNQEACVLVGLAIGKREPAQAEHLWRDACARRHGAACRLVARQLEQPGGVACDCDDLPAPALHRGGGAGDSTGASGRRSNTPEPATEPEPSPSGAKRLDESERFMKLACELGDARACQAIAPTGEASPPARPPTVPAWE